MERRGGWRDERTPLASLRQLTLAGNNQTLPAGNLPLCFCREDLAGLFLSFRRNRSWVMGLQFLTARVGSHALPPLSRKLRSPLRRASPLNVGDAAAAHDFGGDQRAWADHPDRLVYSPIPWS